MKASDIEPFYKSQASVTPLCCQTQFSEATRSRKSEVNSIREVFVSWLFLLGSLMFVLDGVLENLRGISFSSLLHISASILFTIGSVFFIPNDSLR